MRSDPSTATRRTGDFPDPIKSSSAEVEHNVSEAPRLRGSSHLDDTTTVLHLANSRALPIAAARPLAA
jgi:hypothetical protein